MLNQRKHQIASIVFAIVSALVLSLGLFAFNSHVKNMVEYSTLENLHETMNQQAFNFISKIENERRTVEMLAASIAETADVRDIRREKIAAVKEISIFDNIVISDKTGFGICNLGRQVDISASPFFHEAFSGKTVLSEPIEINGSEVLTISSPIVFKGTSIGVLTVSYLVAELDKLFLPSFGGTGYSFVTTRSGKIISQSRNAYSLVTTDNIFDIFEQAEFFRYETLEQIRRNIENDKSGYSKYRYEGHERNLHYASVPLNDWVLFSIVPETVITQATRRIVFSTILLSLVFITLFAVLVFRIFRIQRNNMRVLAKLAFEDELTNAPTVAKFKLEAQRFIDDNLDKKLLMVKFDIDHFKLINQVYGNETGDIVLKNLAWGLKLNTPGNYDRYARIHDDEFLVLHIFDEPKDLLEIRDRYQKFFRELMGRDFTYDVRLVSGHYYMELEHCTNVTEAIEKANIAHREAKLTGKEICIYDKVFINKALKNKEIENKMKTALAENEFAVFLQPKYRLSDNSISGAEALVRWIDTEKNTIMPGIFIPIFERNGFITKLDMYMFEKVCAIIADWIKNGFSPVPVSVNFSRLHLPNHNFVEELCEIADKYKVPYKLLEIELTETTMFNNEEIMLTVLDKLHDRGFTLSMDDFGIGYSSLGLLKNIPVDTIKIDRSFFVKTENFARTKSVLVNIIKMAKDLNIFTVAEGVETKENVDLLRELDCDMVQGYYFSRPMPHDELTGLLSK